MQLGEMLSEFGIPLLTATLCVIITGLALFEPLGQRLGGHGASWNPATNACFAAAGRGSPAQHAVRGVMPPRLPSCRPALLSASARRLAHKQLLLPSFQSNANSSASENAVGSCLFETFACWCGI